LSEKKTVWENTPIADDTLDWEADTETSEWDDDNWAADDDWNSTWNADGWEGDTMDDDDRVLQTYLENGQNALSRFYANGQKRQDRRLRKTKNWQ